MNQLTTYLSVVVFGAAITGCEDGIADRPKSPDINSGNDTNIGSPLPDKGLSTIPQKMISNEVTEAEADLEAVEESDIDGEIEFKKTPNGVEVTVSIEGARAGKHGIHIHERGDCSDIGGKSMGGHFNPQNRDHALPAEDPTRHLGDLGNIEINEEGKGEIMLTMTGVTLKDGEPHSLLGRAFVVHDGEDSGKAKQPAGDSGNPIACGVIERG